MRLNKIAAFCMLILLSSASLYAQTKKPTTKAKPHSASLSASIASGKLVYSKICATCHMADGLGVPNMNPPLVKTTYILGDKAKLLSIVFNGFNETVEIDGSNYSNVMPSQDYLKDQEIADVLTFVRNSFGNKASAVTLAEVKKARTLKK
jgi:mono/diheme cytochrome c family protein